MKTDRKPDLDDDMLPEYDFSKGVRGRFAHLVGCGSFRLESELHPFFETGDQVEKALRHWVAERRPPRRRKRAAPRNPAPDSKFSRNGTVRGFWFARDLVPYFPTEESVNEALRAWVAEHRPRRARARA